MGDADGFAASTRVDAAGDGRYRAEIAEGWDIGGNANGGYLLALVGRAMADAAARPDPVTITGHYLRPGQPGPVTIETMVVRAGRRFSTVHATLLAAEGKPLLTVLGTFGDLTMTDDTAPVWTDRQPPDLPPPEEMIRRPPTQMAASFASRVEVRLHPDDAGFVTGEARSGEPLIRGWFRLVDGEPMDTIALLLASDAFPPTIFNANLPVAWTPTVELTTHVRARPTPGWLRCQFSTHHIAGGFLEEEGELWDETGRLVAHSRQLALLPRGES
jgi:acyl-coenzyme A thioesterase PaaI-like protein